MDDLQGAERRISNQLLGFSKKGMEEKVLEEKRRMVTSGMKFAYTGDPTQKFLQCRPRITREPLRTHVREIPDNPQSWVVPQINSSSLGSPLYPFNVTHHNEKSRKEPLVSESN